MWRLLLTYPNAISGRNAALLDALYDVYPVADIGDRYVTVSAWLDGARRTGLITPAEHTALRHDIAPNL